MHVNYVYTDLSFPGHQMRVEMACSCQVSQQIKADVQAILMGLTHGKGPPSHQAPPGAAEGRAVPRLHPTLALAAPAGVSLRMAESGARSAHEPSQQRCTQCPAPHITPTVSRKPKQCSRPLGTEAMRSGDRAEARLHSVVSLCQRGDTSLLGTKMPSTLEGGPMGKKLCRIKQL